MVLVGIALWAGRSGAHRLAAHPRRDLRRRQRLRLDHRLAQRPQLGEAVPLLVSLAVLVPAALATGRALGVVQFGDDTARGLGVRLVPTQAFVVLVAVGLTAAAVAAAGPISYVALVVPQVAIRLTGGPRPPLLAAGLLGAALVVGRTC
jgi:iron complex transport system permease protein